MNDYSRIAKENELKHYRSRLIELESRVLELELAVKKLMKKEDLKCSIMNAGMENAGIKHSQ